MEIKKFTKDSLGDIRVFTENGSIWFLGTEVAEILGYKAPRNAVKNLVEFEDKMVLKYSDHKACTETVQALWSPDSNDFSDKTLISEPGLYSLIFGSKIMVTRLFDLCIKL